MEIAPHLNASHNSSKTMTLSIMITTRNRSTDLRRTLHVLSGLKPAPDEILITADGCTDDTLEILKAEKLKYENLKVIVNESGRGSVASRDRMMREAHGDLVLALDDDSYPEQPDCLDLLSSIFHIHPTLAIATFPQRTDEYSATLTQTDFGNERAVRSFPNSGACLRVSTYRSLPGFEPMFFHMYEEPDYALQCVAAGWDVRFFPQITIRHHYSGAARSEIRNHHRHARNELWSTLMRCPFPQAIGLMAYRIFSQARFAAGRGIGWLIREPLWWFAAIKGVSAALARRKPVAWEGYRRWLLLEKGG